IADTSMKPLTTSAKESFFAVDYVPGSENFVYASDQGGNENTHLYLEKKTDSAVKDITPWPGSTNNFFGWSNDKKSMYITSNKRNPKVFDLWKIDTASWNAALLYQNDSAYDVAGISKSEKYIGLNKNITTDKNELYLLDRTTNALKRLSNDNE